MYKGHSLKKILPGFIGVIGLFFISLSSHAQNSDNLENSRFQFAETYLGIDLYYLPPFKQNYFLNAENELSKSDPKFKVYPRIIIGGPHFWGHAEFFVNISTFDISPTTKNSVELDPGIETGFRIYPWPLTNDEVTPFAGFSWSMISYKQKAEDASGPLVQQSTTFLQTGLSLRKKSSLYQLGIQYQSPTSFSYPLSRTQSAKVKLNPWQGWFSYKYLFDTTEYQHSTTKADPTNKNQQNDFSIGGGIASIFGLKPSSYNRNIRPYLEDPIPAKMSPDLSLGYHFYELNASMRISYRHIKQSQQAYNVQQDFSRTSLSLEALKFWGDYYGFVPFTGVWSGPEFLKANEIDNNSTTFDVRETKWTWGIAVGWDIRPISTPAVLLRTNIRYAPFLSLKTPNENELNFNHLEVDFIQVVVYPRRLFSN